MFPNVPCFTKNRIVKEWQTTHLPLFTDRASVRLHAFVTLIRGWCDQAQKNVNTDTSMDMHLDDCLRALGQILKQLTGISLLEMPMLPGTVSNPA